MPGIDTLYVELTNNCNYNCVHCGNEGSTGTLEHNLVNRVLNEFKTTGGKKLILTGGEPLLHPRIEDIIAKAQDHGLSTKISTNGSLLKYQDFDFVLRYGVDFRLSLDGTREKHNEIRRNKNAYDDLVYAMKRISKTHRLVVIRTTVMKSNMDHIVDMLYELARLAKYEGVGVYSNNIWPIRNIGKANREEAITAEEYKTFLTRLNQGTRNLRPRFRIIVGPTFGMEKEFEGGPIQSNEIYKCDILNKSLHIAANGDIYPCSFVHHSLGNIKETSLEEVFDSEQSKEFREKFLGREGHECSRCNSYEECKGGCVAETYRDLFDAEKQGKARDIYCFR